MSLPLSWGTGTAKKGEKEKSGIVRVHDSTCGTPDCSSHFLVPGGSSLRNKITLLATWLWNVAASISHAVKLRCDMICVRNLHPNVLKAPEFTHQRSCRDVLGSVEEYGTGVHLSKQSRGLSLAACALRCCSNWGTFRSPLLHHRGFCDNGFPLETNAINFCAHKLRIPPQCD